MSSKNFVPRKSYKAAEPAMPSKATKTQKEKNGAHSSSHGKKRKEEAMLDNLLAELASKNVTPEISNWLTRRLGTFGILKESRVQVPMRAEARQPEHRVQTSSEAETVVISKDTETRGRVRPPSTSSTEASPPAMPRPSAVVQVKDSESRVEPRLELSSIKEEVDDFVPSKETMNFWQIEPGGKYDDADRQYFCNVCHKKKDYKFRSKLVDHKLRRHAYCEKCDKDFLMPDEVVEHRLTSAVHFTCLICHADLGSMEGLGTHYNNVSQDDFLALNEYDHPACPKEESRVLYYEHPS